MSDVDDELLALAGGGDSSDEEEGSLRSVGRAESETPPPAAKKKEAPAKGVATKKAPANKAKKRGKQDDSEEEGEARSPTPSSPSSLQSAPMEESDSDTEAVPASSRNDDEEKYPYEGLYRNAAEKAKIQNMNQLEREMIINERQEEKTRIQQNKLLRQLVRNDEQRNKKRSASTADLEENQRKTSRVRTKLGGTKVGETNAALDTLKSRRAEKNARDRRREEDRERRKDRSPSYQNDRGGASDSESDVEWARADNAKRRSRTPELKEAASAELVDVERVRMSRSRFAKVCFYPGFEDAIKGCFVRISIGQDKVTGENIYRIGYIKGFTKDKPYVISGDQGQQVVTNLYCVATHGKASREWPFIACSDSRFSEAEWQRYKTVCEVESVVIPKKPALLDKAGDINNLLDRKWTEQELNDKLARQQDLKNLFNGVQKKKLEFEMEAAKQGGDSDKMLELQEKLDDLKTSRLAYRTTLTPLKNSSNPGTPTQQERLAQVNAENRRRNAEAVRKAQLAERAKAREIERKIERGELVDEDHSRRVKTKTKFLHDPNDVKKPGSTTGSGASTPANGTPRLGAQKQPLLPHLAKLQQQKAVDKNGIPTIHKPLMDDDIIGALDLDIDENILD